jgi:serine/threonine protein kinase
MHASQAPTVRRSGTEPPTAVTARDRTDRRAAAGAPATGPLALDRYRLQRQLGAGGFGIVWQAYDERLEREVAVKIVPLERVVGGRFEREARAAARLMHPGIVTLYEAGADDDGAYLVSELVRGPTLDALLDAGRLSDQDILAIGIGLCDALEHAHAQGVVHRDVKPSNVLVPDRPVSGAHPAKLTDFGVARVVGGDTLTRTGDVVGTAAYMAPEQAEGLDAGAPADLYALALVLYEALTGVNPVRAGTAAQRARRLGAQLPPLRRQRRDLPRELGQGIDQALRPRPRERGTIVHFRRALEASLPQVGDEPGIVAAPWRVPRPQGPQPEAPDALAADRAPGQTPDADHNVDHDSEPDPLTLPSWPERGLAALAAAALIAWLLAVPLGPTPIAPTAVALMVAAATLAMPRIGWLVATLGVLVVAIAHGQTAAALVIGPAMIVPVLLMPAAGVAWPLAAGSPALGVIGLAGAWPALAARAPTAWRRAALGFTGWLWLAIATPLAGTALYLHQLPGTPTTSVWMTSSSDAVHHVVGPLLTSGAVLPGAVWALAAVTLPSLVNGRSLVADTIRVIGWATLLVGLTAAALTIGAAPHATASTATILLGALAACAVALAPTALAQWREARRRLDHSSRGVS